VAIDWPATVHVLLTRQAFLTSNVGYSYNLEWPFLGGNADRFNPFFDNRKRVECWECFLMLHMRWRVAERAFGRVRHAARSYPHWKSKWI